MLTRKQMKPLKKICLYVTVSMTNPMWTDLEFNLNQYSDRQVTNCNSHGSSYCRRCNFFPN